MKNLETLKVSLKMKLEMCFCVQSEKHLNLLQRHWRAAPNVDRNEPTNKSHSVGQAKLATIMPPRNDCPYLYKFL